MHHFGAYHCTNIYRLLVKKGPEGMVAGDIGTALDVPPETIRDFFTRYETVAEIANITQEMLNLRHQYISSGVVTPKSAEDALHVAIATVTKCNLIVSWNFKHIVHFDKIPKYNAVNTLNGYGQIGIYSPMEVINYDGDDS